MSQRGIVLAWVFLASAIASSARAELTAFWRNNPITPEAIGDDPALGGMQSWSVMVTNTNGLFASAGLRATLPPENRFYRNQHGGAFRPTPPQVTEHPALTFHTYVTAPRQTGGLLAVFGGFPDVASQASFGGPLDLVPGTFAVSWGDADPNSWPPGTYEIARLTFPVGVHPLVHPQSVTYYIAPDQNTLLPTVIPEPSAVVFNVMGLALLFRSSGKRESPVTSIVQ